jgi:transposase-like protein
LSLCVNLNPALRGRFSLAPRDRFSYDLIQEIRRRERVIRIFPNEASAQRLIGALLAEKHETWITGKKYLDMTEYLEARAERE